MLRNAEKVLIVWGVVSSVGVDASVKLTLTPSKLSEARFEKIKAEPSSSVPVKTSLSLKIRGEDLSLIHI